MRMTLSRKERAQAVIEYLDKRGVSVKMEQVRMCFHHPACGNRSLEIELSYSGDTDVYSEVLKVDLPPKNGPYR